MLDRPDGRHFFRYSVPLPFLHRGFPPVDVYAGVGWTWDVSEGGACVELPEHLHAMQPLRFRLQTDRGAIEVEASVVWKADARTVRGERSGQVAGGIRHGVVFTRLASDQYRALRELLRSLAGPGHPRVRLPLDMPALCLPQQEGSQPLEGWTADVSRGGLSVRLPHPVPPGTGVEIRVETPNASLTVEGVVVWTRTAEGRARSGLVRHGIRFTAIGWYTLLSLGLLLTVV